MLGAIVSPTDPIAATAIARRLGVPRKLVMIVECESLDAAVALARRIPTLPSGGTVEVRPLEVRDA